MGAAGAGLFFPWRGGVLNVAAQVPVGTLDPTTIPKFQTPMLIPPVMPVASILALASGQKVDSYKISMRQFSQQVLPAGMPKTTVWGYGPVEVGSARAPRIYNAPSMTIEAQWNRPVRVKWVNELLDARGRYLPHLFAVDPTIHWANPGGGVAGRDSRPAFQATPGRYTGPVPLVTHLHGAVGVGDESDGYSEAWYLPDATNLPDGYAKSGTWYGFFAKKALAKRGVVWEAGAASYQYPNLNRASTLWYHDHTLGLTRLNVYAGGAGFYIVRGGPAGDSAAVDRRTGKPAVFPGPAPAASDAFPSTKPYYEIPIAIQDRAFNADGSLFYPDTREYFDGIVRNYIPQGAIPPMWNPEFFGNCIMVNGNTWPYQAVERRRYRFRFLNGCQSRFLMLNFASIPGVEVWQIGNEGGFLPAPVNLTAVNANRLLLALAERADVIVDFTNVPEGNYTLGNVAPDEPFGGGVPDADFAPADPATTGQVLQFRVGPAVSADTSTPPQYLGLPSITPLPAHTVVRPVVIMEMSGAGWDASGAPVEGPVAGMLGTVDSTGNPQPNMWADPVTENPAPGSTELWEIYNTTADAHPMHIHEAPFEVVNRETLVLDRLGSPVEPFQFTGNVRAPEPWEAGLKDTVISYPGEVIRIRARFNQPGQYAWHCHIVEHEDNEMMRPYRVGPPQPGQPS
ncbi:MAG TPA: bilirubin oxidase [Verrucomicrobiales bacterium]|nr:bilirubin oxidase [Verrucomicrobiales bacterium]